jgi:hypothetical protein
MIKFSISEFHWSKSDNTFYAQELDLLERYDQIGERFVIYNQKTGNERTFSFVREESFEDPIVGNYFELTFTSEDGLNCKVMSTYPRVVMAI